jgi:hypothetical protein
MTYWPFWVSALALATVATAHFLVLGRMLAVSGRFSAIVDRFRFGKQPEAPQLSEAELIAALQAATLDAFGDGSLDAPAEAAPPAPAAPTDHKPKVIPKAPASPWVHALFLASLFVGGLIAALGSGTHRITSGLRSAELAALGGSGVGQLALLLAGGAFVGFGTRMAGGCTSGHGLCGVSRFQLGSLVTTAAFFGTGVAVSFLLGAFR